MSALDSAVELLRCFSPARPELSHAEVVALTGRPKSSTSRLLRALRDCGLLEQDQHTRRYRPGLLLFELGRLYGAQNDLVTLAERHLREVCERTGHTGYITVLDGAEHVVLRMVPGSNPLRVVTPPGLRAPAFATSNGRALLARLSDAELRRRLPDPLPVISHNSPKNFADLMARIVEIRRTGVSEARDETLDGVGSLGFAVGGGDTEEAVGIAVSYSSQATSATERAQVRDALNALARRLGRITGDPMWSDRPAFKVIGQ
jgi:DNA-binding IclR family transcriptional regulator